MVTSVQCLSEGILVRQRTARRRVERGAKQTVRSSAVDETLSNGDDEREIISVSHVQTSGKGATLPHKGQV